MCPYVIDFPGDFALVSHGILGELCEAEELKRQGTAAYAQQDG